MFRFIFTSQGKKKYFRGTQAPFTNKTRSKQTMKSERVRTKCFESRGNVDLKNYIKEINHFSKLLGNAKRSIMKKNHSYIINIIKVLGISQSDHKYFAHEIKDPVLHLL